MLTLGMSKTRKNRVGCIWGVFGINLGSLWSLLGPFGVTLAVLEPPWGPLRSTLASFRMPFGTLLGYLCSLFHENARFLTQIRCTGMVYAHFNRKSAAQASHMLTLGMSKTRKHHIGCMWGVF